MPANFLLHQASETQTTRAQLFSQHNTSQQLVSPVFSLVIKMTGGAKSCMSFTPTLLSSSSSVNSEIDLLMHDVLAYYSNFAEVKMMQTQLN